MALDHYDVDIDAFKTAVGSVAAGVVVITVRGGDGRPSGMTATAFSSVSTNPFLVLVCVHQETRTRQHILRSGSFGINLLASGMRDVSNYCAAPGADKTLPDEWLVHAEPKWSAPALHGSIAFLDCEVYRHFPAGTHTVVVGRVCAVGLQDDMRGIGPLLHFRRRYRQLAADRDVALASS